MKNNDWKARLNVVYSTNPDYQYENEEIEEAEQDHEFPAGEIHVENSPDDNGCRQDADDQPRFELAPF